jgi:aryl-alcohol dehydrogenase-like predicted oxidoreductase
MGLGVMPWSPLGGGLLSGKYNQQDLQQKSEASVSATRRGVIASSGHMTARSLEIAGVVGRVAAELGVTPSQVALAWTLLNPSVASPVIGARTLTQAEENFAALGVQLAGEHIAQLDQASAPEPIFPSRFIDRPMVRQLMFGGATVRARA